MKKRSMLAVASLITGAAIAALSPAPPAAHAATLDGPSNSTGDAGSPESRDADHEDGATDA
ncbi:MULTISPECIES: hypothetical protein [Streptomyces]|uniref:hypothetical protein n=1 Tax=Streptomyces TaxID=1883 RepID=UPI0031CDD3FA